jgi:hypothetical protein
LDEDAEEFEYASIGEFSYDIPVVFRLLMSVNPRVCYSLIWDNDEPMALAADYDAGLARLAAFVARIDLPEAQPMIQEALDFLNNPDNKLDYFVLEAGELYAMGDGPEDEQNLALLVDLQDPEPYIEMALRTLRDACDPGSSVARQGIDPTTALRLMGFGSWSEELYYDLG